MSTAAKPLCPLKGNVLVTKVTPEGVFLSPRDAMFDTKGNIYTTAIPPVEGRVIQVVDGTNPIQTYQGVTPVITEENRAKYGNAVVIRDTEGNLHILANLNKGSIPAELIGKQIPRNFTVGHAGKSAAGASGQSVYYEARDAQGNVKAPVLYGDLPDATPLNLQEGSKLEGMRPKLFKTAAEVVGDPQVQLTELTVTRPKNIALEA